MDYHPPKNRSFPLQLYTNYTSLFKRMGFKSTFRTRPQTMPQGLPGRRIYGELLFTRYLEGCFLPVFCRPKLYEQGLLWGMVETTAIISAMNPLNLVILCWNRKSFQPYRISTLRRSLKIKAFFKTLFHLFLKQCALIYTKQVRVQGRHYW